MLRLGIYLIMIGGLYGLYITATNVILGYSIVTVSVTAGVLCIIKWARR